MIDTVKTLMPCSECGRDNASSHALRGGWEIKCKCAHSVSAYGDNAADACLEAWNNGRTLHRHSSLIAQIDALLRLDAANALAPHGIGGHARELLTRARAALAGDQP